MYQELNILKMILLPDPCWDYLLWISIDLKVIVVEGKLQDKKYFIAEKILAKHDENYMPPEVSKALEEAKNNE